jgi:hypothetical protein
MQRREKNVRTKPKEGYVLIKLDTSCDPESHSGGVGAVLKHDVGRFIAACNDQQFMRSMQIW